MNENPAWKLKKFLNRLDGLLVDYFVLNRTPALSGVVSKQSLCTIPAPPHIPSKNPCIILAIRIDSTRDCSNQCSRSNSAIINQPI